MSWSVLVCGCDFHCRREMSTFPRPMARAARRGKAEDCSSSGPGPVTEPRYHGAYKNRSRSRGTELAVRPTAALTRTRHRQPWDGVLCNSEHAPSCCIQDLEQAELTRRNEWECRGSGLVSFFHIKTCDNMQLMVLATMNEHAEQERDNFIVCRTIIFERVTITFLVNPEELIKSGWTNTRRPTIILQSKHETPRTRRTNLIFPCSLAPTRKRKLCGIRKLHLT